MQPLDCRSQPAAQANQRSRVRAVTFDPTKANQTITIAPNSYVEFVLVPAIVGLGCVSVRRDSSFASRRSANHSSSRGPPEGHTKHCVPWRTRPSRSLRSNSTTRSSTNEAVAGGSETRSAPALGMTSIDPFRSTRIGCYRNLTSSRFRIGFNMSRASSCCLTVSIPRENTPAGLRREVAGATP